MSLMQCSICGCIENSACTNGYHMVYSFNKDSNHPALVSYKKILGLKPDEPFREMCSVCCPVWYDEKGNYGVGPNPNPTPGMGLWHGRFERTFLPKGQFETNRYGNLVHTKTGDEDIDKYKLDREEGT